MIKLLFTPPEAVSMTPETIIALALMGCILFSLVMLAALVAWLEKHA